MTGRFHKMHGLGNDFVVIDTRHAPLEMSTQRARSIADRHTGVGCDQVIVLAPSNTEDALMRIWNADGSTAAACGNAFRAISILLGDATLETLGGPVTITRSGADASVTMQPPSFAWNDIPLAYPVDTGRLPVAWDALANPVAVNVGNPHVVFFVDNAETIDLEALGPRIENDPLFPDRVNVNVASITGPSSLRLRTWERGAGLTRACGTGACATAVAAIRSKRVSSPVDVEMTGGNVIVEWHMGEWQTGSSILMTGPATHVFSGEIDWELFPV